MHAADVLLAGERKIAVAVSGGSDSLALLFLLKAWADANGAELCAATVDHGLRAEAADEARMVAGICQELGVGHETLKLGLTGAPTQERLRLGRHRLLACWARGAGAGVLALGHTQDDRIETFLMRARAGSDWWGLAGPAPSSASPVWPAGGGLRLVRPLAGLSRAWLRQHLSALGRGWADDPSNASPRYERSRMRVLVRALSLEARSRLLRTQGRFLAMRAAVMAEALRLSEGAAWDEGSVRLWRRELDAAPALVRLRLLEALVLSAGGREAGPRAGPLVRLDALTREGSGATTLGRAMVRWNSREIILRPAPPRRGIISVDWGADAAHGRARSLLSDPRAEALSESSIVRNGVVSRAFSP